MPTINANRVGYIIGNGSTNYNTARSQNGNTAVDSPSTNFSNAIQAFFSSGRGGGTFKFNRTYIHFDTTSITSTLSSATLKVTGASLNSGDVIVLNGQNAFNGDGSQALKVQDFNQVNITGITQPYSSIFSSWSTSGVNSISLNSSALSALVSNDDVVMGLVNGSHDHGGDSSYSSEDNGIAFGTAIQLEFTLASSGDIDAINGISLASIARLNDEPTTDIDEYNGLTF